MFFFLYVHPYLAQHKDFRNLINHLLPSRNIQATEKEFDFQAENLKVTYNGLRDSARVLMLRTDPKFSATFQELLTSIYSATSTVDLGPMRRYKFVPITSDNTLSDQVLHGLIKSQAAFAKNVFHYKCENIYETGEYLMRSTQKTYIQQQMRRPSNHLNKPTQPKPIPNLMLINKSKIPTPTKINNNNQ